MPGMRAKRLCPEGIFVTPRMAVYVGVSEQVMAVFARYTPLAEPLFTSPYNVGWPVFSPDGRWLAYTSTESGKTEVWVRRFPVAGPVPVCRSRAWLP